MSGWREQTEGSALLPVIREMQSHYAVWLARLLETGQTDPDLFQAFDCLRQSLYTMPINTSLDALLLCGALRELASGYAALAQYCCDGDASEVMLNGTIKAMTDLELGLATLTQWQERAAGIALGTIGAFTGEVITLH